MKSQNFRVAVLFVSALALTGCTTFTEPFAPPQSFDTNADIEALETVYGKASSITEYYGGTKNKDTRNEFISGRLALINLHYILFIREFAASKAQLETAMDMLQLGVDLTITVVGGESIKALLGAASSGITGTRVSINKNFFFEETVPALITAMNAARKEALFPILRGIEADFTAYTFATALSDLEAYYFAGTFIGGLQAIQKDAGAKEVAADLKIEKFRITKFRPDTTTGKSIDAWSKLSVANNDSLVDWRRDNGIGGINLQVLLTNLEFEAMRVKAIKDLNIPANP